MNKQNQDEIEQLNQEIAHHKMVILQLGQQITRATTRVHELVEREKKLKDTETRMRLSLTKKDKQIEEVKQELRRITKSVRYQTGAAIVEGVKSPIKLLKLPMVVLRIFRKNRFPQKVKELRTHFTNGGSLDVIEAVDKEFGNDKKGAGAALVQAAVYLTNAGYKDAELPILKAAVKRQKTDAADRALFWAAQRAGDFVTALECIYSVEERYGKEPKASSVAMLEKLKGQPSFQLSILSDVEPPKAPKVELEPNRVAYVLHNSLPWSSGGYATRAHGMALGMTNAGQEVICVTRPGYPLDLKPELDAADIPLSELVEGITYRRLMSPLRTGMSPVNYMRDSANTLTGEFRALRPAYVMAASNHLTALPALIAARRLGIPFIYEVRGFWEITRVSREPSFEQSSVYHLQKSLESEIVRAADHVVTLTSPMRAELILRGADEEALTILPNCCDPDRFAPRARDTTLAEKLGIDEDVPVIGYIGTFVQYEGLENLVSACAILRDRGKTFRLMLVGNENASGLGKGEITETIERLAAENNLVDWLIMPGRVDHSEVEAYYSLIDVAPFPRKPQPVTEMVSPMKPLEALAMEKAIVVSSVAALAEMVTDGETGLIFRKGDIEDMANTIERLIDDPALRTALGRNGREWVKKNRTWNEIGRQATRIFAEMETIENSVKDYRPMLQHAYFGSKGSLP